MSEQKLKLISQGLDITMIDAGLTPVLVWEEITGIGSLAARTVNFLRCRCAFVQIVVQERKSEEYARDLVEKFHKILHDLQLPGERFKIVCPATFEDWPENSVMVVTRLIADVSPAK
jgi:hypothetical protein